MENDGAAAPRGLAPVTVERLGAPTVATAKAVKSTAPDASATPTPSTRSAGPIEAELVAVRFEPVPPTDVPARERALQGGALELFVRSTSGDRPLLKFPVLSRLERRAERVSLPASGSLASLAPEPRTPGERPADFEILLLSPARALAFGESPPPPVDWETWIRAGSSATDSRAADSNEVLRAPLAGSLQHSVGATLSVANAGPRYQGSAEVLLMGSARAVLIASPPRSETVLEAALAFRFLEGHLTRLERETARFFVGEAAGFSERLAPGSPEVDREPDHLAHVKRLQRVRRELALLEPVLDAAPRDLAPAERALFETFGEHHDVERRLEALDARLEVLEDQSEVVGERLLEVGLARKSERVEWLIVWILLLEVLVMGVEAYLALKSYKLESQNTPASATRGPDKG